MSKKTKAKKATKKVTGTSTKRATTKTRCEATDMRGERCIALADGGESYCNGNHIAADGGWQKFAAVDKSRESGLPNPDVGGLPNDADLRGGAALRMPDESKHHVDGEDYKALAEVAIEQNEMLARERDDAREAVRIAQGVVKETREYNEVLKAELLNAATNGLTPEAFNGMKAERDEAQPLAVAFMHLVSCGALSDADVEALPLTDEEKVEVSAALRRAQGIISGDW